MQALQLGEFEIKLNHRKVLDAMMQIAGEPGLLGVSSSTTSTTALCLTTSTHVSIPALACSLTDCMHHPPIPSAWTCNAAPVVGCAMQWLGVRCADR